MDALAAELGVSHQAMQKYETGANRISVPVLYAIAGALRVWVGDLYEGLPPPADVSRLPPRTRDQLERFLASPGGPQLMAAFIALPRHLQKPLVAMALASAGVDQLQLDPHDPGEPGAPTR
jgi:transcriptional regulator with XRE-family HTH domain